MGTNAHQTTPRIGLFCSGAIMPLKFDPFFAGDHDSILVPPQQLSIIPCGRPVSRRTARPYTKQTALKYLKRERGGGVPGKRRQSRLGRRTCISSMDIAPTHA